MFPYSWAFALLQQEHSRNLHFEQNNLSFYSIIVFTVYNFFFISCQILKTDRILYQK